jgi:hypothetical protein
MKRLSIVGGICASLLLGMATIAVAQDEHKDEKPENAKPESRQEQARPQEQAHPQGQAKPDERKNEPPQSGDRHEMTPQNEGKPAQQPQSGDRHPERQQDERQMQQPETRPNTGQQQEREKDRHEQAQPQGQMPSNEHARTEGHERNQRRISEPDFHAHFGRAHRFHPGRIQVYEGRPQFNYSGYVFELVEPWPMGWAYDADDYYIDYIDDEYWLYSFDHPGVRLEVFIIG